MDRVSACAECHWNAADKPYPLLSVLVYTLVHVCGEEGWREAGGI